jgi:hypothetical protein
MENINSKFGHHAAIRREFLSNNDNNDNNENNGKNAEIN